MIVIYGLVSDLSIPYLKNYRIKMAISGSTRISITPRIRPFCVSQDIWRHFSWGGNWKEGCLFKIRPSTSTKIIFLSNAQASSHFTRHDPFFFFLDVCFLSLDRNVNLVATLLSTSQIYHYIQTLSYFVTLTRKLPNTPSSCLVLTFWLSRLKHLEINILIFCVHI